MATENKIVSCPSWINNSFVQKALHNAGEKNVEVESCMVDIGTAPGDNYSSVIYRAKVKIKDGSERTLLIKTVVNGEEMDIWARKTGCFGRESMMLTEILPQIEALFGEVAPERSSDVGARCFLHGDSPNLFIVMEDMRPQGFRMADRKRGLGLRHCLLAIRALARYHAAGHALIKRNVDLTRLDNVYNHHPDYVNIFIEGGIQAAADVCKTWSGFEECARRLDKFKLHVMKSFRGFNDPNPELFNVILHGDFWTNNIMFRYVHDDDDRNPCEVRMVDFQSSHVASPALDLLYFLSTSLSEDVSTHHQDLLIREYYSALKETLSLLGMEAPSFETLLADIDSHGPHSLLGTITVHPIVKATHPPNFDAIMIGDLTTLVALYNSPEVKKYLQRVLPQLAHKGWLPV